MAKSQTLETLIKINAKTGNGFSEVGSTLQNLGNLVSQISTPLLEFGKESTEVYRNYELSMKDAEIALATTYGKNSNALSNVMEQLNESASQWAATTKFHTDDVANAIANAAHAGWDLNEIMTGIPAAMKLAQAGGLDLSQSVDYIVKASNGAGLEFDQMSHFIDLWAFTANSTATDIGEMGDALVRLGPLMKFTDSSEELMTILGTVADVGITGSQAGTMLRSSLLRLIAPTKNAAEAMDELEATDEELLELADMTDELAEANARLEAAGFSMYDENGKMKPVLDTFEDLYTALGNINGGFDDLYKNGDVNKIMAAIFPQRSLVAAEALLEAAGNGWNGLYESMMNGDAEGYADYAAEERLNTLDGALSILDSKVEELKRKTGKELSDPIENIAGILGGIVDNLNTMDPTAFSAIVSGLSVLAGAGPGLFVAGSAMKWIGSAIAAFPGGGDVLLIATAVAMIAAAVHDIDVSMYHNAFGDMELDATAITEYLGQLSEGFSAAYKEIEQFNTDLGTALTSYQGFSSELSGELVTKMLTGAELTSTDITKLEGLGEKMMSSVSDGISASYAAVIESLKQTMGEDNPDYESVQAVLLEGYAQDIATAEDLSQQLRNALTSAFADKELHEDEIESITSIMNQINDLMAMEAGAKNFAEQQLLLRRAQSLSLEGMRRDFGQAQESRDTLLESRMSQYYEDLYKLDYLYQRKIDEAGTEEERAALQTKWSGERSIIQQAQSREQASIGADFNKFIAQYAMTGLMNSPELSDSFATIRQLSSAYAQGGMTTDLYNRYLAGVENGDISHIGQFLSEAVDYMGGFEAIASQIQYFDEIGDEYGSSMLRNIVNASNLIDAATNFTAPDQTTRAAIAERGLPEQDVYSQLSTLANNTGQTLENLYNLASNRTSPEDWMASLGWENYGTLAEMAGGTDINSWLMSTIGEGGMEVPVTPVMEDMPEADPIEVPATAVMEETAPETEPYTVSVEGDTTAIEGDLSALDSTELTAILNGNTDNLHTKIMDEDGQTLTEFVAGDPSMLASAISQYDGRHITVYIDTVGGPSAKFAEGGRATEASIFGEGSTPEWAIPEEHSERTASLLDQARRASGFTWPEILSRFGGLNANPENVATTIVYSPTINAADATGVAQALSADKDRFERWFREHQMREALEVYA